MRFSDGLDNLIKLIDMNYNMNGIICRIREDKLIYRVDRKIKEITNVETVKDLDGRITDIKIYGDVYEELEEVNHIAEYDDDDHDPDAYPPQINEDEDEDRGGYWDNNDGYGDDDEEGKRVM